MSRLPHGYWDRIDDVPADDPEAYGVALGGVGFCAQCGERIQRHAIEWRRLGEPLLLFCDWWCFDAGRDAGL